MVLLQRFAHLEMMPFIMKLRAWAQVGSHSPQSPCAPREASLALAAADLQACHVFLTPAHREHLLHR